MSAVVLLTQLWQHARWADAELFRGMSEAQDANAVAWREYAHVLGAEETWLSRLEGRASRLGVWPALSVEEAGAWRQQIAEGYSVLLGALGDDDLVRVVDYRTSDGRAFSNTTEDILVHVALHGQYHRGKVNLMLRQRDQPPVPVDFIAFVRGAPSATTRPR